MNLNEVLTMTEHTVSMRRTSAWLVGILVFASLSMRSATAQPEAAAWTGISPVDPTGYERTDNWIDLVTGQVPFLPPDETTDVFFDRRAEQAERDPFGRVLISGGGAQAKSITVESLPFLLIGADVTVEPTGSVIVHNGGELGLDNAGFTAGSVFVGGGPLGPTAPGSVEVATSFLFLEMLHVWDGSVVELFDGEIVTHTFDIQSDSERFQWSRGGLVFEEFVGDLTNPSGFAGDFDTLRRSVIHGDYSQGGEGILAISLAGLTIEGTLNAAGSLWVESLSSDPTPTAGSEYDVLDFGSINGQFDSVVLPDLPSAFEWDTADLHSEGIIRVFDPTMPAVWTGAGGDGDYLNPANWDQGIVPANENDDLFALTIPGGADISVPPDQAVRVTRLTQAVRSAIEVQDGSTFEVSHDATLSGTISAVGPGATFTAIGPAVELDGAPHLLAARGGAVRLSAERYDVPLDAASSTLIAADGPRSFVDLATLETMRADVTTDSMFTVAATNGGEIDLTGLVTIAGVAAGSGELLLRAASGGTLRLGDATVSGRTTVEVDGHDALVTTNGGLNINATSNVRLSDGGTITLAAPLLNSGTITGTGTLRGTVVNDGLISPGSSIGLMDIDGDLSATENAIFSIEIVGGDEMDPPESDRVTTTHRMMLAGHLIVMFIEGGMGIFEPLEGDEFELFSAADGVSGRFHSVSLPPLPPDLGWLLLYDDTDVALRVVERLPGDFDADGDVDRGDLLLWQTGVGLLEAASQTDGDANGDRGVDGHDLLAFLLNFDRNRMELVAASGAAVPEPPSAPFLIALLIAVSAGPALRRRREVSVVRAMGLSHGFKEGLRAVPPYRFRERPEGGAVYWRLVPVVRLQDRSRRRH